MDRSISIVIIGRNEESGIARCINAAKVAADQIGGAEMIYVDSASTDNTVEIARSLNVKVLSVPADLRLCPSAGRFVGSQRATGEYLLFLDADTLIYKDFLATAITRFESDPTIGGINGR